MCSDDTSSEDLSSVQSKVTVLKVSQEGNKKTKLIACDSGTVEFSAYFPKPKVIHSDIRRSYGPMFVNAMNSGDLPLLYGFLDTFLVPNATKVSRKTFKSRHSQIPLSQTHISEQQGVVDIAKHWYCRMQMSPDTVIAVKDVKIVSNSKTDETKILSRFSMKATKIMGETNHGFCHNHSVEKQGGPVCVECNLTHFRHHGQVRNRLLLAESTVGKKRPCTSEEDIHRRNMHEIVSTVNELVSTIPRRTEPIQLEAEGDFIMYIDENRRITRLEMSIDV